MTDKELRIKVAELCGWKEVNGGSGGDPCERIWRKNGIGLSIYELPRYESDLNAMHEAEITLENNPFYDAKYWTTLYQVLDNDDEGNPIDGPPNGHWCDLKKVGHATARQRAEAFVKTMEEKT